MPFGARLVQQIYFKILTIFLLFKAKAISTLLTNLFQHGAEFSDPLDTGSECEIPGKPGITARIPIQH